MFYDIHMSSISIVSLLAIIAYLQLALHLVAERGGRDVIYEVVKFKSCDVWQCSTLME